MKKIISSLSLLLFFGLTSTANAVSLTNPLGATADPRVIIGNILNALLGLIGSIALIMFIAGGVEILLSTGNSDKIKKGRDTMVYAAIGLAIIFSSYALVNYVITALTKA